jgi:hypothetical protein
MLDLHFDLIKDTENDVLSVCMCMSCGVNVCVRERERERFHM